MTWSLARDFLLFGLAFGGLYALLAQGLVLTYRASGFLNFSHPYVGMLATYVFVFTGPEIGVLPAALLAILVAAAISAALYVGVFSRFTQASLAAKVIVSLAAGIGLQAVGGIVFVNVDLLGRDIASLFPDTGGISILGGSLTAQQLALPVAAVVVAVGLVLLLGRTDFGLALRASAQNPMSAGLAGIPARSVELGAWALSGALAGLAGVLYLSATSFLVPTYLFGETIRGFVAALAGAFVDLKRAVLAALALGILEQELVGAPSPWNEMRGAVSFAILTALALAGLADSRAGAMERGA